MRFINFIFLFFSFIPCYSQEESPGVVLDKIISKIDDYIVLKSELESTYLDVLSRGQRLSGNTKCAVLKNLITNKLLVAKAEIDSVMVEDSEVNQELDSRMNIIINQVGSEEEIENYYNKTISEFKNELFDDIKQQLVANKMRREILSDISVSPEEVRRFFNNIPKDSIPYFSTQVQVSQIVKIISVGDDQKEKAKLKLIDIRNKLISGENFEILATLNSEDFESAKRGGRIGFVGRGVLQPEYEEASLKLNPGEISMPIETKFGFHLIELIEKRGNMYDTRHILIKPKISDNDIINGKKEMDSLKNLVTIDSVSFEELARKTSDDKFTSSFGGYFTDASGGEKILVDELDPVIFFTIDTMKVGSISPPMQFRMDDGSQALRILFYKNKILPHLGNLKEDYQRFRTFALNKKQSEILDNWFEITKSEVFITIDDEYNTCNLTN
jgi:peptidyl-prolyl cis-trans isomerase SurA